MGGIIPFQDSHRRTQMLLPWFANGTLYADDRASVQAHLDQCAECRDELDGDRALAARMAAADPRMEAGWARLRAKLDPPASERAGKLPLLRRPVQLGRAIAAQVVTAGLVVILLVTINRAPADTTYEALGANVPPPQGNIVVLFEPGTRIEAVRAVLDRSGARIADGPTASGAFVISVDSAGRPAALTELRAMDSVLLAEPVDPAAE